MRILIIEDDPFVAAVLERRLGREDFGVLRADTGEEGISLAHHYRPDLVLLDLTLPDMPGLNVLRRIKRGRPSARILVLSGDAAPETRVRCLDAGADDYLCKPCHGDELVARVKAVVRRTNGHVTPVLRIGEIDVDTERREVLADGAAVPLTRREYQLLELLALRRGAAVEKEDILAQLYDGPETPDPKIVDVYVCKIRRKLAAAAPQLTAGIDTIWGRGYALRPAGPMAERAGVRPVARWSGLS